MQLAFAKNLLERRVVFTTSVWLLPTLLITWSCSGTSSGQRYSQEKMRASLSGSKPAAQGVNAEDADKHATTSERITPPGLLIGEYNLPTHAVVDGDTIKVIGLDSSLRLLAIDSEETFKNDNNRRAAATDFAQYLRDIRGSHRRPRKTQTPLGEAAKKWGEEFLVGVSRVRLERDQPKELKGRFNRYLAYVFVQKHGRWINYNLEHVRAGMSPYFTKYGYSRRFHEQFVAAEKEARQAQRGIWAPGAECNNDYDEREKWWNARAEFIKLFEQRAQGRDDYIVLTHWDAIKKLEKFVDQEVSVLALVSSVKEGKRGPIRVQLSRRLFDDLTVIFWDRDVFDASGIEGHIGEFVVVKGIVQIYENKYRQRRELQLVVKTPSQITRSRVPGIPLDGSITRVAAPAHQRAPTLPTPSH